MARKDEWKSKQLATASLHLDARNPRLGRETSNRAPRDIIQYLFEHDKALEVAQSIVTLGYFPNEPLLVIEENGQFVVVEGNRRLAALKALREPGLLDGTYSAKVARLSKKVRDPESLKRVPVTIAPSRKATDQQIAGRHRGSPVLAWVKENRASFIIDKLSEGYTNDTLRDELGFTLKDIQEARQTRAIADMARSLKLSDEVQAKLNNPRGKIFSTIERVFDSSAGQKHLRVERSAEYGILGTTTKKEFLKGFERLVSDIALKKQSSRSLNTNDDIDSYFKSWKPTERPANKRGSFVPDDVIKNTTGTRTSGTTKKPPAKKKTAKASSTVIPRSFVIRDQNDRLIDIRSELIKLKREDYPNAGATLLRVFLELSIVHFLEKIGEMDKLVKTLKAKNALQFGTPTMRQMMPVVVRIAKKYLPDSQSKSVQKAVRYDKAAPFSISDMHSFVHQTSELPSERDIRQFWMRTEPLFKLMLDETPEDLLK